MEASLLVAVAIGLSVQNITKKAYSSKGFGNKTFTFSLISCIFACLFFLLTSGFKLNFTPEILPYSLGFGLSYGSAVVFTFLAVKTGPLSLSALISSYSLMIPSVYGLIFLNEQVSPFFYGGLGFLAISLFLINYKPRKKDGAETGIKITPKWLLFVFLGFLGNGICSTVQAVQQKNFAGAYKSEFMIISLLIVIAVTGAIVLGAERKDLGVTVKRGGWIAVVCGSCNGLCNLMVMILAVRMDAALLYPLISAGSIILTSLVSIFLYKEKLSRMQLCGLVFGIISVVLMNI